MLFQNTGENLKSIYKDLLEIYTNDIHKDSLINSMKISLIDKWKKLRSKLSISKSTV